MESRESLFSGKIYATVSGLWEWIQSRGGEGKVQQRGEHCEARPEAGHKGADLLGGSHGRHKAGR